MNCKKCGCKIERNQKFCTRCGTEIIIDNSLKSRFKLSQKTLAIIFEIIIGLSTLAIGVIYTLSYNKNLQNSVLQKQNNENLYKVWQNDEILFINESGEEVLKIKSDKDKFLGEFREGRLFIGKQIKEVSSSGQLLYSILELSILDKKGNILKTFDKKAVAVVDDSETVASYLPEIYNGYAVVHFIDDSDLNQKQLKYEDLHITNVYVDKNGQEIKNIPDNVKKMLADENITATRFETNDLNWKDMPCSDNPSETCVGYIDKNKMIKIKPIYDYTHLCSGDWYGTNPNFINHYALVFTRTANESKNGNTVFTDGYRFINDSGEYINNEVYDYAQPFYGNLAYVAVKNKYGFINKQGQWVWSAIDHEQDTFEQLAEQDLEQTQNDQGDLSKKDEIIEKYNNLKFDKEEMLKAYKESNEYCQTQNCTTNGMYLTCQGEYINGHYPKLYDKYIIIHDYCLNVKDSYMAEMMECIQNEISSF